MNNLNERLERKELGTSTIVQLIGSKYYVYLDKNEVPCAMEHDEYGEIGGLWICDNKLTDYDGCYTIPSDVVTILDLMGYDVSYVTD